MLSSDRFSPVAYLGDSIINHPKMQDTLEILLACGFEGPSAERMIEATHHEILVELSLPQDAAVPHNLN